MVKIISNGIEYASGSPGSAISAVGMHDIDANAHSDIRELISAMQEEIDNIEANGGGSSNEVNDATKQYVDAAIEAAFDEVINASY